MSTSDTDSVPMSPTVERGDVDGPRASATDGAVVVCLEAELPSTSGPTDVSLAPLCAAKAHSNRPNYHVCRHGRHF